MEEQLTEWPSVRDDRQRLEWAAGEERCRQLSRRVVVFLNEKNTFTYMYFNLRLAL